MCVCVCGHTNFLSKILIEKTSTSSSLSSLTLRSSVDFCFFFVDYLVVFLALPISSVYCYPIVWRLISFSQHHRRMLAANEKDETLKSNQNVIILVFRLSILLMKELISQTE